MSMCNLDFEVATNQKTTTTQEKVHLKYVNQGLLKYNKRHKNEAMDATWCMDGGWTSKLIYGLNAAIFKHHCGP
jgi:hypothetical protein